MSSPIQGVALDQRGWLSPLARVVSPLAFAVGVIVGAGVFALRHEGWLGGGWAIGIAVLVFLLGPGPRRLSERYILVFAVAVGFLPLIAWVPSIELKIDVPGVLLALAAGITAAYQVNLRGVAGRTLAVPSITEVLALLIGAGVIWWWERPFSHLGLSGTLYALFQGYDNNFHFGVLNQNLQLGSSVLAKPTLPNGIDRLGYNYPQGMHQGWAELVRLVHPRPSISLPWLIHTYVDLTIITCGGIVLLGCLAIARLCDNDFVVALPAMAVVAALFAFGRLEPLTGFTNTELSVAAVAVAVTLMIRPTLGPRANFLAVAGLGFVAVDNWYPVAVMLVPALIVAALRALREPRARVAFSALIAATAAVYLVPVAITVWRGRGAGTLNFAGTGIHPSWGLVLVSVIALIGFVAVRQALRRDTTTNLILVAPALLGLAGGITFCAYEYASVGVVSHYGQKFALCVFGVCAVVLVAVIASDLSRSDVRRRIGRPLALGLTVIATVAALQLDGYVGPWTGALQSTNDAYGITIESKVQTAPARNVEAQQVLLSAQIARAMGADTGSDGHWWYIGVFPTTWNHRKTDFVRLELWFASLVGAPPDSTPLDAQLLGKAFGRVHSPARTARIVSNEFSEPIADHDHLFVPAWLRTALIHRSPKWGEPGVLLVIPNVSLSQHDWPD